MYFTSTADPKFARFESSWLPHVGVLQEKVYKIRIIDLNKPGLKLECSGWGCNGRAGGPLPSPSLPSFLSLRSRAPKIQLRVWESAVSSPAGSGAELQPTNDLVHFNLKIWHLVATVLITFLRINWPNWPMATLGMMYPARGGLIWGQMSWVLSEVKGVYTSG